MSTQNRALAWWLVALWMVPTAAAADNLEPEIQAAGFLIESYETVVGVQGRVLPDLRLEDATQEFGKRYLGLPLVYLMGGLKAVTPDALTALETAARYVFVGSKEFVGPFGLGMADSRTCYIAVLAPGAANGLSGQFDGIRRITLGGQAVWRWDIPRSEGQKTGTTFYAAIVNHRYFVLTNREGDLAQVLAVLGRNRSLRNLPSQYRLKERLKHAYWAYRALDTTTRDERSAAIAGVQELDVVSDWGDEQLVLTVSGEKVPAWAIPTGSRLEKAVRFEASGVGKWRAFVPLNGPDATVAVFWVMSLFGYSVSL